MFTVLVHFWVHFTSEKLKILVKTKTFKKTALLELLNNIIAKSQKKSQNSCKINLPPGARSKGH